MAKFIKLADEISDDYGKKLVAVLRKLEKELLNVVKAEDAAAILNSRPVMLKALQDSGYNQLAADHIAQYPQIGVATRASFKASGLPDPKFTTPSVNTFNAIGRADLEGFQSIGTKAMDDLRLGLFRQATSNRPFSDLVETVRASTTGVAKNGSPLLNYAETHARTAIHSFQGEVLREAGESIGADKWEVVGPDDAVTRDVCSAALSEPVRTKDEWIAAGYWGGAPGGWNCRHQLFPSFE